VTMVTIRISSLIKRVIGFFTLTFILIMIAKNLPQPEKIQFSDQELEGQALFSFGGRIFSNECLFYYSTLNNALKVDFQVLPLPFSILPFSFKLEDTLAIQKEPFFLLKNASFTIQLNTGRWTIYSTSDSLCKIYSPTQVTRTDYMKEFQKHFRLVDISKQIGSNLCYHWSSSILNGHYMIDFWQQKETLFPAKFSLGNLWNLEFYNVKIATTVIKDRRFSEPPLDMSCTLRKTLLFL